MRWTAKYARVAPVPQSEQLARTSKPPFLRRKGTKSHQSKSQDGETEESGGDPPKRRKLLVFQDLM